MKSIRSLLLAIIISFSFTAQRAHALSSSAIVVLATIGASVVATIVNASVGSIDISANSQEAAIIKEIEDDAAAFIMNGGDEEPSVLLASIMNEMKANEAVKKIDEEVTDLDIAKILLQTAQTL